MHLSLYLLWKQWSNGFRFLRQWFETSLREDTWSSGVPLFHIIDYCTRKLWWQWQKNWSTTEFFSRFCPLKYFPSKLHIFDHQQFGQTCRHAHAQLKFMCERNCKLLVEIQKDRCHDKHPDAICIESKWSSSLCFYVHVTLVCTRTPLRICNVSTCWWHYMQIICNDAQINILYHNNVKHLCIQHFTELYNNISCTPKSNLEIINMLTNCSWNDSRSMQEKHASLCFFVCFVTPSIWFNKGRPVFLIGSWKDDCEEQPRKCGKPWALNTKANQKDSERASHHEIDWIASMGMKKNPLLSGSGNAKPEESCFKQSHHLWIPNTICLQTITE